MLRLRIVSPEKIIFTGEVDSVLVPGELGEFEILNNHAPIISTLSEGRVVYKIGEESGGFVEVQKNEVSICVELKND